MNRRDFLSYSAAGAAISQWSNIVGAMADKPPRVALVGCGWYGKCDMFRLIQIAPVDVVAVCDVDKRMMADAAKQFAGRLKSDKLPKEYTDYRKLLAEEKPEIVLVGTPDHWHALPMIAAVEAGAHVYVQKPISVDVLEGKAMLDAARKHNRVVQVGTQRRGTPHLIDAKKKVVDAGLLGNIGQVEIYCYYHMRNQANPPVSKPPEYFDYDMWTGPAPLRQYDAPADKGSDPLPHRRWWRAFNEYGNGIVGDMCIHMLDLVRWQLGLGWPKRISSTGGIYVQKAARSNISDTQTATFEFDKFPVIWNHRTWGPPVDPDYPWGATIYGDKGTLKMSVMKYEFFPAGKKEPSQSGTFLAEEDKYPEDKTEKDLERHVASAIRVHMRDFLKSIADKSKPAADIEQGYISTASCILANNAMKIGRTLAWDPAKHEVTGDAEANKLLKRAYRDGWKHPAG